MNTWKLKLKNKTSPFTIAETSTFNPDEIIGPRLTLFLKQ